MIKIFHITSIDNLSNIVEAGTLYSDTIMIEEAIDHCIIGMNHIKERRLATEVPCNQGTKVGEYVPFYFCPRSVMLFAIDRNHPDVTYRGRQREIIHLVSSVETVTKNKERLWAFSDGNAGTTFTRFYNKVDVMDEVLNRDAIEATYWADPVIKEKKQAEFLVHKRLNWGEIHDIGVYSKVIGDRVEKILKNTNHKPKVLIKRDWYY